MNHHQSLSSPLGMNQFGGRQPNITQMGQHVPVGMQMGVGQVGQMVGGGQVNGGIGQVGHAMGGQIGHAGQMVHAHGGQTVNLAGLSPAQIEDYRRRQAQQQQQQQHPQLQGPPPLLGAHHPPPPQHMQHPNQQQYAAVRRVGSTPNLPAAAMQYQQQRMGAPTQARLSAPEGFHRPGSAGPGVQVSPGIGSLGTSVGGFPTPAQQYNIMHGGQRPPSAASPAGAGDMGPPARPVSAAAGPMGALPHHVQHPQQGQNTLPPHALLYRPSNIGPQPGQQMVNGHGPGHPQVNGGPPPPPPPPPQSGLQHPPPGQQHPPQANGPHPLTGPHVQHQMNGHHPSMNGPPPQMMLNGPQQHPQQQHPGQPQPGQPGQQGPPQPGQQPQQHPQMNGQPQPPQQQQQPPPIQTQQLQQSRPGSAAPSSAHTQVTAQAGSPDRPQTGQTPAPGPSQQPQAQNVGTPQQAQASVARGSMQPAFGHGAALARLVQFSGALAVAQTNLTPDELRDHMNNRCTLRFWDRFMEEWFAPGAVVRLQLWKDNQTAECKSFEITTPVIPRFFLATSQSGVRGMSIGLDDAKETPTTLHHAEVRTSAAQWVYRYVSGYTVVLRGQICARFSMAPPPPGASAQLANAAVAPIRIEEISFTSHRFDVLIDFEAIMPRELREHVPARETAPSTPAQSHAQPNRPDVERWVQSQSVQPWGQSAPPTPSLQAQGPGGTLANGVGGGGPGAPGGWDRFEPARERWPQGAWVPERPVNAFGIPQMTMRCLELAESVTLMDALVLYAKEHGIGAMDALKGYASAVVQMGIVPPPAPAPPSTSSDETLVDGTTQNQNQQQGPGQYPGYAPGAFPHGFATPPGPFGAPPPRTSGTGAIPPPPPPQTQGPGQPGPGGQQTQGPGQPGPQAGPSTPANAPPQSPAMAAANAGNSAAPSPRAAPKKRGQNQDGTPKMANSAAPSSSGAGPSGLSGGGGGESPAPAAVAGTKRKGRESVDGEAGGSGAGSSSNAAAPAATKRGNTRKKARGTGS